MRKLTISIIAMATVIVALAAWFTVVNKPAETPLVRPDSHVLQNSGLGVTVVEIADEQTWELHFSEISQCTLIVDAILGTGLTSAVSGMLETVIADVNASDIPIVAVDLPSGLSADTPHLPGDCVDAAMTVTLAAPKLPLILPPGEAYAGDVVIAHPVNSVWGGLIYMPWTVVGGNVYMRFCNPGPVASDGNPNPFYVLLIR